MLRKQHHHQHSFSPLYDHFFFKIKFQKKIFEFVKRRQESREEIINEVRCAGCAVMFIIISYDRLVKDIKENLQFWSIIGQRSNSSLMRARMRRKIKNKEPNQANDEI